MLESSQRIFSPPGMAEALDSFIPVVSRDLSSAIVFLLSVPPDCSLPCPFILTPCPSPRRIGIPEIAGWYATRSRTRSYRRSRSSRSAGSPSGPPQTPHAGVQELVHESASMPVSVQIVKPQDVAELVLDHRQQVRPAERRAGWWSCQLTAVALLMEFLVIGRRGIHEPAASGSAAVN